MQQLAAENARLVFVEPFSMSNHNQAELYLANLDLNYLIEMMCDESYALPRWTEPDAKKACGLYKKFLLLQKKYPNEHLVPTREIDEVWHNHILHTKQYHKDCNHIFGYYLHHEPALKDGTPEKLIKDFLKTKKLFEKEFDCSP